MSTRIDEPTGDLLWRRVYEAEANLRTPVTVLPQTLRALLEQADVREPEDDVVGGPLGELWHGRTLNAVDREAR